MIRPLWRAAAAIALLTAGAAAETTSDRPAAMLIYPRVFLGDIATRIQLTNVLDQMVDVRCSYEVSESRCSGPSTRSRERSTRSCTRAPSANRPQAR